MNANSPYTCPVCERVLRWRGRRVLLSLAAAFLAGVTLGLAVPR